MPRKANFIFDVRIRIAEAFSLDSIIRSPRTFKPKDVLAACNNNELVIKEGSPPKQVVDLVTYVMTDFFSMAHGTGLYNRQMKFWESLSHVNSIHVFQLSSGLMKKTPLQVFDFAFLDYKGKPLIYALLVAKLPEKSNAVSLLKGFISRCAPRSTLCGMLACFAKNSSAGTSEFLTKLTYSDDQILRYESILPALRVPIDLLQMEPAAASGDDAAATFSLVHPDLKKGKELTGAGIRFMKKVMPQPKREINVDSDSPSAASDAVSDGAVALESPSE